MLVCQVDALRGAQHQLDLALNLHRHEANGDQRTREHAQKRQGAQSLAPATPAQHIESKVHRFGLQNLPANRA